MYLESLTYILNADWMKLLDKSTSGSNNYEYKTFYHSIRWIFTKYVTFHDVVHSQKLQESMKSPLMDTICCPMKNTIYNGKMLTTLLTKDTFIVYIVYRHTAALG